MDEITIFSKVGLDVNKKEEMKAYNVTVEIQKQLLNLGVEAIDLMAVHHRNVFTADQIEQIHKDMAVVTNQDSSRPLVRGMALSGGCIDQDKGGQSLCSRYWQGQHQPRKIVSVQTPVPLTSIGICPPLADNITVLAHGLTASLSVKSIWTLLEAIALGSMKGTKRPSAFGLIIAWYIHNRIIPLSCSSDWKHLKDYIPSAKQGMSPALLKLFSDFHLLFRWSLPCDGEGIGINGDVFGIYKHLIVPLCSKHKVFQDSERASLECAWYENDVQ